jgi:hypothetical protein
MLAELNAIELALGSKKVFAKRGGGWITEACLDGGEPVSHRSTALPDLIAKRRAALDAECDRPMSPEEFREALIIVNLSRPRLAFLTDYSEGAARGWDSGRSAVPPRVATWLRALVAHWRANPPPPR